ncbi:alcohol dehydrogenase catalytic domain-containing protein, partial [Streptomyces sp. NPDC056112]|uniref:alcohol dehydrogenase catalytic domain-containing protein n=1 Tax=Streptomyces sp. NPDC056112 TaxID=3345715 RepID=UPI0035D6FE06
MTETYHAVQYTQYGGPEVLGVVELQAPHPGPREVLVRVRAAGVNPIAWKLRTGALAAMMPVEFPAVPGGDVADDVEETGDGVCGLTVGDEVFGSIGSGGYAELALAPAGQLARKPEAVSCPGFRGVRDRVIKRSAGLPRLAPSTPVRIR